MERLLSRYKQTINYRSEETLGRTMRLSKLDFLAARVRELIGQYRPARVSLPGAIS
jgi:hypothetical protein